MIRFRPSSGNVVDALLAGTAAMATTSLAILVVAGAPAEPPGQPSAPAVTRTRGGSGDTPATDPARDRPTDPPADIPVHGDSFPTREDQNDLPPPDQQP